MDPPTFGQNRRRLLVRGIATVSTLSGTLGGCSFTPDHDHDDDGAPLAASGVLPALPPAPLALVLGSGGPRGFAHVGVLKALDELQFKPDLIVGASIGALVGALYASGYSGSSIERIAMSVGLTDLLRIAVGATERFSGSGIASWVNRMIENRPIEKLGVRFAAVAVRDADQSPMAFVQGDAGVAIQASCAIPGTFTPVRIRGRSYVDPDRITPVPVRVARRLGAGRVLSVDVSAHENRAPAEAQRFRDGDLAKRALIQADVTLSDLNLHPFFGYWVNFSEEFRRRAINAAYEQTMEQRNLIAALNR